MTDASESSEVHAIVLAAGASIRFGSPKQLVRVQGRPLLHTTVSRAVQVAGHSVTVVLGAHAEQLAPLLRHSPATVIVNRTWSEGIASSIRAGIQSLSGTCSGALLMLADQAGVTEGDLRRLIAAWRRQPGQIAAAQYGTTCGAPAIFPRESFGELLELRGDRGAQAILQRRAANLTRVPLAGAALDIDTPEDLLQFTDD